MDQNFTDITIVLDRSGSMDLVRADTIGGFNSFVENQKSGPGKCNLTLVQFSDNYEVTYKDRPITEAPLLTNTTFSPFGFTSLFDAVGRSIKERGTHYANMKESERPGKVLFVIITDGEENASKEYKLDQIKNMIQDQTKTYNWTFVFLGAYGDKCREYL
jgi:hypothetical protein